VGSVASGGSGKTPLAAWLALELCRRGHRVVLATRGYGRVRTSRDAVSVVSDGGFVFGSASASGDEPMLLAGLAPGVPVIVAADRGLAGLRAVAAFGADVLVLDDGFQHHRLARDLDVVCLDAGQGLADGRVLPRGPLREPSSALSRADAVVVVDPPLHQDDASELARLAPDAFRSTAVRRPVSLRSLDGQPIGRAESIAGMAVGLLSGLARPAALRRTVESLGASVVAERRFPDHHRFGPRDLRGLARCAPLWLTTQKDASKILPEWCRDADVRVLEIEMQLAEADALLEWLEARLARLSSG
jgi:tetraacyldisaccharide 4'-kinase